MVPARRALTAAALLLAAWAVATLLLDGGAVQAPPRQASFPAQGQVPVHAPHKSAQTAPVAPVALPRPAAAAGVPEEKLVHDRFAAAVAAAEARGASASQPSLTHDPGHGLSLLRGLDEEARKAPLSVESPFGTAESR